MRLVCFLLFLFIHSAICINESDVRRRYSVNHPPSIEDYDPIPVSVVYEDDIIDMKSHKPKYYDISRDRHSKQKFSTTEGSQLLTSTDIQEMEPIYKNKTERETEDILVRPTARVLGERHIPVAIIYDSPLNNTQNLQAIEETNLRRKKIKRVSRRKPLQNKTAENENFTKQSTQEPRKNNDGSHKFEIQATIPVKQQLSRTVSAKSPIENDGSAKSETQRTKPIKPQLSRTEAAKTRIDNGDSIQSNTQRTKPVKPKLGRVESAKPQTEIEEFIKSVTQSTKLVKPQLSRSESAKPRIASDEPRSSKIETKPIGVKTKQVRDPVVPIIEMENYVYAHNGNFHYSYEGGDGTKAHSEGQLRSIDDTAGEAVSGGFSYTDKDGNDFSLSYTADEHGYRPIGAHLPTPPPIPPAIARALAYLATATTPEPVTKPSVKHAEKSL